MLLHINTSPVRRLVVMALIGLASFFAVFPNECHGQGVAWAGAEEGDVIELLPGMASTNLVIAAAPATPALPENLVFALERQGKVVLTLTSPPPYALTFTNLSAGKYFLSAMTQSPALPTLGDLSFDIRATTVRPPNDDWDRAAILATLDTAVVGSNSLATREKDEPAPGGGGAGKSIWWAWTASSSGTFSATTAGSDFDTLLGVYAGASLATLVSVASNDDIGPNAFSQATFSATNGVTYYFCVDGASGSVAGHARLRLLAGEPPSIAIVAPPDGYLMLVASSANATNASATIAAADPAGLARVEYWFDGGTNVSRSGLLAPPYQLSLTNLFAGHYLLTVAGSNNVGLISVANAGLSVISLEPTLVMDRPGSLPGKFQLGLMGFKGPNYTLQASKNLDVWCGVGAWTNFTGAVKVADTNAAQSQQRFYRAMSVQ